MREIEPTKTSRISEKYSQIKASTNLRGSFSARREGRNFFGCFTNSCERYVSHSAFPIREIGRRKSGKGEEWEIVSKAAWEDTINVSGPEIPKCVMRSDPEKLLSCQVMEAVGNTSHESSWSHSSLRRKLESEGQRRVIECPRFRANVYPSQADPVWV